MSHYKQLFNYKYLGAYSLDGKDMTLTIKSIDVQDVVGDSGRTETCPIITWQEDQKPMILNKTNAKQIGLVWGTTDYEKWIGKKVTLFADVTKLKGEMVECLRIRPKKPGKEKLTKDHKAWEKAIEYVVSGKDIKNIEKQYELDGSFQDEVDRRTAEQS